MEDNNTFYGNRKCDWCRAANKEAKNDISKIQALKVDWLSRVNNLLVEYGEDYLLERRIQDYPAIDLWKYAFRAMMRILRYKPNYHDSNCAHRYYH